jgi:hypothetical protein
MVHHRKKQNYVNNCCHCTERKCVSKVWQFCWQSLTNQLPCAGMLQKDRSYLFYGRGQRRAATSLLNFRPARYISANWKNRGVVIKQFLPCPPRPLTPCLRHDGQGGGAHNAGLQSYSGRYAWRNMWRTQSDETYCLQALRTDANWIQTKEMGYLVSWCARHEGL